MGPSQVFVWAFALEALIKFVGLGPQVRKRPPGPLSLAYLSCAGGSRATSVAASPSLALRFHSLPPLAPPLAPPLTPRPLQGYFDDPFNSFDLFVVLVSFVELIFNLKGATALRAFRLARVFKAARCVALPSAWGRVLGQERESPLANAPCPPALGGPCFAVAQREAAPRPPLTPVATTLGRGRPFAPSSRRW